MNLLKEGIEQKAVEKIELTKRLTVDGVTKVYPVYRIRLDQVFFNDQNDRIATWISKYKSENNIDSMDMTDLAKYNDIIHEYIYESNPEAIKKTQKNIELINQEEPGVVLNDGRIIDGNRRFTCLRNLSKDNPRFNYFEAIILDRDLKNSEKQIKMLELSIQHGKESRVEYNPIDRLVGIYSDVVERELLTPKEYANSINITEGKLKGEIDLSKLLVEYLEFINAPKQYHIAREMDLDGPLREIPKILKSAKNDEDKEDLKNVVFTNLLLRPGKDLTRFIRKINTVARSRFVDEYVEEQMKVAEDVLDKLEEIDNVTLDTINDVFSVDDDSKNELERSLERAEAKANSESTLNMPLKILEKISDNLEALDTNLFRKFEDSDIEDIKSEISVIEDYLQAIKEDINV